MLKILFYFYCWYFSSYKIIIFMEREPYHFNIIVHGILEFFSSKIMTRTSDDKATTLLATSVSLLRDNKVVCLGKLYVGYSQNIWPSKVILNNKNVFLAFKSACKLTLLLCLTSKFYGIKLVWNGIYYGPVFHSLMQNQTTASLNISSSTQTDL